MPPQPSLTRLTRLAPQPELSMVVLPLGFGGQTLLFFFFLALAAECSTVPVRETCCPASLVGLAMFLSHLKDKWDFTEEIAPVLLA